MPYLYIKYHDLQFIYLKKQQPALAFLLFVTIMPTTKQKTIDHQNSWN